jgi:hypothetical protein
MNSRKTLFIGLILGASLFFGVFAYFVGGVSGTIDPIKTYEFNLTKDELRGQLDKITSSIPGCRFRLTDSTGTKDNRAYHCNIIFLDINRAYDYNIEYEKEENFWNKISKSNLSLIGAFDNRHNTGGYRIEAEDVQRLTDIFEKEIINRLEDKNTSR